MGVGQRYHVLGSTKAVSVVGVHSPWGHWHHQVPLLQHADSLNGGDGGRIPARLRAEYVCGNAGDDPLRQRTALVL